MIRAPRIAAGVMAGAIFALSAWGAAPMIPGGDEPHYLIITQSLLLDRALTIENKHRRGDYRAYYGGELQPHVQRRGKDGRIYSIHAPGLPALVAPAFALGGYRARGAVPDPDRGRRLARSRGTAPGWPRGGPTPRGSAGPR